MNLGVGYTNIRLSVHVLKKCLLKQKVTYTNSKPNNYFKLTIQLSFTVFSEFHRPVLAGSQILCIFFSHLLDSLGNTIKSNSVHSYTSQSVPTTK